MRPALRKLMLTLHVAVSVGWFGAAAGVLALAIAGITSADAELVAAAYLGTAWIWRFVIIPFGAAALLTGVIQALGTPWGLFRHYWVLAKFCDDARRARPPARSHRVVAARDDRGGR